MVPPLKRSVPVPDIKPAPLAVWVPPEKARVAGLAKENEPVCVPPPLRATVPAETDSEPLLLKGTAMVIVFVPTDFVTVPALLNVPPEVPERSVPPRIRNAPLFVSVPLFWRYR
jgi:hypothetical protein